MKIISVKPEGVRARCENLENVSYPGQKSSDRVCRVKNEHPLKILKNCFGDPITRRISEAVLIDELSADETMNGKNEWTYIKLNKI